MHLRLERTMVRSRSENNLNRIIFDLCTSPQERAKHLHERTYHPPLPSLKAVRSNSCSDIDNLSSNSVSSGRESPIKSTATLLVPMQSTGFSTDMNVTSSANTLHLFGSWTVNDSKTSSTPLDLRRIPSATPSNSFNLCDHQDFPNRLRNRLKARGHLRKFFLAE